MGSLLSDAKHLERNVTNVMREQQAVVAKCFLRMEALPVSGSWGLRLSLVPASQIMTAGPGIELL